MARTADRAQNDGTASKDVGRQLRHVRRKQGLSRAEVARSAGLTRRELAAYERGKADVPESDLWCLAGSCGVDVAELLPNRAPVKVNSDLSMLAIGDSIRYLRNPTDDDEMLREYLAMIYELRNLPPGNRIPLRERDLMSLADALGGTPERIEARLIELIGMSNEEATRLRSMILPANALPAAAEPAASGNPYAEINGPDAGPNDAAVVDFFSTPRAPDVFEPPPPPGAQPATNGWSDAFNVPVEPVPQSEAYAPPAPEVVFESFDPATALVDAPPPIPTDPFAAPMEPVAYAPDPTLAVEPDAPHVEYPDEPLAPVWTASPVSTESPVVDAPMFDAPVSDAPTTDWTVDPSPLAEPPVEGWVDAEPLPRRQPLTPAAAPVEAFDVPAPSEPTTPPPAFESYETPSAPEPAAPIAPEAFVPTAPLAPMETEASPVIATEPVPLAPVPPAPTPVQTFDAPAPPAPPVSSVAYVATEPPVAAPTPFVIPEPPAPPTPGFAPIAWIAREQPSSDGSPGSGFRRAGSNWRIGGIFPATATADDGALALRRADARWALADLDAPGDFTAEATVDFSAGAGFGVLFRASVDESDRVSGYSFDVDPIAGGGGYLVRQWEDNRQHWRPIAQAGVTDPTLLFGRHTVVVTLRADQLTVVVDNEAVLAVPALSRCSIELGRPPCRGTRVGIQAWATTEVTIDSFRVARH